MSILKKKTVEKIYEFRPRYRGIKTFIETGTYHAHTVRNMIGDFKELHTIELARDLYEGAIRQCGHLDINFHCGDSKVIMPRIAESVTGPIFFYLDAHGFSDPAAASGFPLWDELDYIKTRKEADIVAIDDVATFGLTGKGLSPDWKTLTIKKIANRLGTERNDGRRVFDNVLVIYRRAA